MLVLYRNVFQRGLHKKIAFALVATACLGPIHPAQAQKGAAPGPGANQLNVQVNDDRMTLSMARVPQIYLYGPIDPDAPQRFEALVKSGRIKPGSDVYLNSPGGSVDAGMALGRLFRQDSMVTHLGTPRLPRQALYVNRSATCEGACAYAYLGGVYRWAVSGSDRIGFPTYQAQQTPAQITAYLKDMGIDPTALVAVSGSSPSPAGNAADPTLWPNGDQMIAKGLANNGRQNLIATYKYAQGAPYLELKQGDRNGVHMIKFQCKPGGAELTSYDTIGAVRARQIVAREQRSYFELNQQETLAQQAGATAVDESVVIHRIYPLNQLPQLASAKAMGAWVRDRTGIRYGFAFEVTGVKKVLNDFYNACTLVTQQH
jgi:hypothetical protein